MNHHKVLNISVAQHGPPPPELKECLIAEEGCHHQLYSSVGEEETTTLPMSIYSPSLSAED